MFRALTAINYILEAASEGLEGIEDVGTIVDFIFSIIDSQRDQLERDFKLKDVRTGKMILN